MVTAVITISLLLDRVLGEPSRFHPLIGFGRLALMAENRLIGNGKSRMRGVLALILLMVSILLPITVVVYMLVTQWPPLLWLLSILFLYLAIGGRSLAEHAEQVASALDEDNLIEARRRVGMIVSRDCEELDEEGVARAAVETVLENGSDAIFAPIFWFIVLGIPGVVLYRIVNT
ncbi:MAG: cobalamin biosynthesis protein, partial [Chromatiales bacterium]|nr:cobalamin biosynthesis protein [Chromatiales bacterium]